MEGPSEESVMDLPPGFRFHPTDEELISQYLKPKVINRCFYAVAVEEVDLNKCEPWDLPRKTKMGEKEWYFYCHRDRKYPTGTRTNRATKFGYWKATGKDKEIYKIGKPGCLIGMKKTLVFYKGRAPKGEKTNWVMHEYRLEGEFSYYKFPNKDEWVVSRIFHKNSEIKRSPLIFPTSNSPYNYDPHLEDCSTISPLPLLIEDPTSSSLKDEEEIPEGITKVSFPLSVNREDDDYLSYLSVNLEDSRLHKHNVDHFTPYNYNYSVNFLPQSPSRSFANHAILRALGETETSLDVEKKCKVGNLSSNQSMISVSHDTAVTTDMTAETSSSRHSDEIYEFLDINNSYFNAPNIWDGFDCSWDY